MPAIAEITINFIGDNFFFEYCLYTIEKTTKSTVIIIELKFILKTDVVIKQLFITMYMPVANTIPITHGFNPCKIA